MYLAIGCSLLPESTTAASFGSALIHAIEREEFQGAPNIQPKVTIASFGVCGGKTNVIAIAPEIWQRRFMVHPTLKFFCAQLERDQIVAIDRSDYKLFDDAAVAAIESNDHGFALILRWMVYWVYRTLEKFPTCDHIALLDPETLSNSELAVFAGEV